jgi:hypothetical protein
MNEQIRLLAEQAGVSSLWMSGTDQQGNSILEKFAELIINECIDQVAGTKIVGQILGDEFDELSESARSKYTQWNNALVIATMNVKEHFGVEE